MDKLQRESRIQKLELLGEKIAETEKYLECLKSDSMSDFINHLNPNGRYGIQVSIPKHIRMELIKDMISWYKAILKDQMEEFEKA